MKLNEEFKEKLVSLFKDYGYGLLRIEDETFKITSVWDGVEYGRNTETGQYFKVSDYKWGLQNCEPITEEEYIGHIKKNVKIDFLKWEWSNNRHEFRLIFSYNQDFDTTKKLVIGNELSKQIEKYLNNEID